MHNDWVALMKTVRVGKKLPDAVYIHVSALGLLPEPLQEKISRAKPSNKPWNMVKINRLKPICSYLWYPGFETDIYPELVHSTLVDLVNARVLRHMSFSSNPPILHKKELFVRPDDPRCPGWAAITKQDIAAGRYTHPSKIGFKKAWQVLF